MTATTQPPSWRDYLLGLAAYVATKSKDSTKVGAVLVHGRHVMLTAYNGPPHGVRDLPERRDIRPDKYLFAAHAEANLVAIAARHSVPTHGATVYCTHAPCAACTRTMIAAGIGKIVHGNGTTSMPHEEFAAAAIMCREAGVPLVSVGAA